MNASTFQGCGLVDRRKRKHKRDVCACCCCCCSCSTLISASANGDAAVAAAGGLGFAQHFVRLPRGLFRFPLACVCVFCWLACWLDLSIRGGGVGIVNLCARVLRQDSVSFHNIHRYKRKKHAAQLTVFHLLGFHHSTSNHRSFSVFIKLVPANWRQGHCLHANVMLSSINHDRVALGQDHTGDRGRNGVGQLSFDSMNNYDRTCHRFSIREYVKSVREVDPKRCWPFKENEVPAVNPLPAMEVSKFRWWGCNGCLADPEPYALDRVGAVLGHVTHRRVGEGTIAPIASAPLKIAAGAVDKTVFRSVAYQHPVLSGNDADAGGSIAVVTTFPDASISQRLALVMTDVANVTTANNCGQDVAVCVENNLKASSLTTVAVQDEEGTRDIAEQATGSDEIRTGAEAHKEAIVALAAQLDSDSEPHSLISVGGSGAAAQKVDVGDGVQDVSAVAEDGSDSRHRPFVSKKDAMHSTSRHDSSVPPTHALETSGNAETSSQKDAVVSEQPAAIPSVDVQASMKEDVTDANVVHDLISEKCLGFFVPEVEVMQNGDSVTLNEHGSVVVASEERSYEIREPDKAVQVNDGVFAGKEGDFQKVNRNEDGFRPRRDGEDWADDTVKENKGDDRDSYSNKESLDDSLMRLSEGGSSVSEDTEAVIARSVIDATPLLTVGRGYSNCNDKYPAVHGEDLSVPPHQEKLMEVADSENQYKNLLPLRVRIHHACEPGNVEISFSHMQQSREGENADKKDRIPKTEHQRRDAVDKDFGNTKLPEVAVSGTMSCNLGYRSMLDLNKIEKRPNPWECFSKTPNVFQELSKQVRLKDTDFADLKNSFIVPNTQQETLHNQQKAPNVSLELRLGKEPTTVKRAETYQFVPDSTMECQKMPAEILSEDNTVEELQHHIGEANIDDNASKEVDMEKSLPSQLKLDSIDGYVGPLSSIGRSSDSKNITEAEEEEEIKAYEERTEVDATVVSSKKSAKPKVSDRRSTRRPQKKRKMSAIYANTVEKKEFFVEGGMTETDIANPIQSEEDITNTSQRETKKKSKQLECDAASKDSIPAHQEMENVPAKILKKKSKHLDQSFHLLVEDNNAYTNERKSCSKTAKKRSKHSTSGFGMLNREEDAEIESRNVMKKTSKHSREVAISFPRKDKSSCSSNPSEQALKKKFKPSVESLGPLFAEKKSDWNQSQAEKSKSNKNKYVTEGEEEEFSVPNMGKKSSKINDSVINSERIPLSEGQLPKVRSESIEKLPDSLYSEDGPSRKTLENEEMEIVELLAKKQQERELSSKPSRKRRKPEKVQKLEKISNGNIADKTKKQREPQGNTKQYEQIDVLKEDSFLVYGEKPASRSGIGISLQGNLEGTEASISGKDQFDKLKSSSGYAVDSVASNINHEKILCKDPNFDVSRICASSFSANELTLDSAKMKANTTENEPIPRLMSHKDLTMPTMEKSDKMLMQILEQPEPCKFSQVCAPTRLDCSVVENSSLRYAPLHEGTSSANYLGRGNGDPGSLFYNFHSNSALLQQVDDEARKMIQSTNAIPPAPVLRLMGQSLIVPPVSNNIDHDDSNRKRSTMMPCSAQSNNNLFNLFSSLKNQATAASGKEMTAIQQGNHSKTVSNDSALLQPRVGHLENLNFSSVGHGGTAALTGKVDVTSALASWKGKAPLDSVLSSAANQQNPSTVSKDYAGGNMHPFLNMFSSSNNRQVQNGSPANSLRFLGSSALTFPDSPALTLSDSPNLALSAPASYRKPANSYFDFQSSSMPRFGSNQNSVTKSLEFQNKEGVLASTDKTYNVEICTLNRNPAEIIYDGEDEEFDQYFYSFSIDASQRKRKRGTSTTDVKNAKSRKRTREFLLEGNMNNNRYLAAISSSASKVDLILQNPIHPVPVLEGFPNSNCHFKA